jgi:sugar O-acyltransferase (sialic acid O-acetyltransferase NeuD family)
VKNKLVIVGDGKIADVAYQCFATDGSAEVVAFCVEREFRSRESYKGLPVVDLEVLALDYPSEQFNAFVAIGYHECNKVRARLYHQIKNMGYQLVSYISPQAWVPVEFSVPANSLLMAHVTIQPGATLGENVAVYSGCVVGHHSSIGNHCWLASGATVGGAATVGDCSFLGMNSTIGHEIVIGERCFLGGGTLVTKNLEKGSVLVRKDSEKLRLDVDRFQKITKMR